MSGLFGRAGKAAATHAAKYAMQKVEEHRVVERVGDAAARKAREIKEARDRRGRELNPEERARRIEEIDAQIMELRAERAKLAEPAALDGERGAAAAEERR